MKALRSVYASAARRSLLVEGLLLALALVLVYALGAHAEAAWRARVGTLAGSDVGLGVAASAARARAYFTIGTGLLFAGRLVSFRRGREAIRVAWLVPATTFACLLGFVVHQATVEVARGTIASSGASLRVLAPSVLAYAEGYLVGAAAAFAVLASPIPPTTIAARLKVPIAIAIVAIFVALALVGSGPSGSGTRINLGPVQPIEVVKPLTVLFLAAYLGARATKLRWQRQRWLGLRWPRAALLLPAILALVGIFAGLYVVGDLGPVSILAFVFLGMFYVATRATGWVVASLATVIGLVTLVVARPGLVGVGRVVTRIRMWQEPFWNGIAYGDQLGEGLWAIAAGGRTGQGLGEAYTPLVAAGKTDLVLATLAEQLGATGVVAYVGFVAAIVFAGFHVAARTRTPERVLLAAGVALLVATQFVIIHGGTYGTLPLTGIVVPFVSSGRSSLVAFLTLVALVARVGEDGSSRTDSEELVELRASVRAVAGVTMLVLAAAAWTSVRVGIVDRGTITSAAIATRLADGKLAMRSNPRLLAIVRSLRRGTIEDRNRQPLATSDRATGRRNYPLGTAMGTLLGAHPSRVLLPSWALERVLDRRLRGYPDRKDGPFGRPWADLRRFAPLLDLPHAERERRIRAIDGALRERSVRLTIDARLQRGIAELLARHRESEQRLAIAAAVIDVDTGEMLARVQTPDLDPNDPGWQATLLHGDEAARARFTGAYGAWQDKTGIRGLFQSGSIGKLFTSLAAARRGWSGTDVTFECSSRDAQGPFFTRPGWSSPIHDHHADPVHGHVDLVEAIAESCNVYFGQLALALGRAPFLELANAGVDVGYGRSLAFEPGAEGSRQLASTGFGQGALAMNVVQASRLVAAIGDDGRYRVCPSSMELGSACTETSLVTDPRAIAPILAGMRRVVTAGTGRRLDEPEGVRVYGKTGTADVRGFAGEEPFGIARASAASPHSWFVALGESSDVPEGATHALGRLAVAVVVPRGGSGASAAGPVAMEILALAKRLGWLSGR